MSQPDQNAVGKIIQVDKTRRGDPMTCFTGQRFYPLDPRPEEVNILDIAQALSNQSRYGGHCRFYSIAEHSVLVSKLVPPEHALTALLHDASETYTNDITRPVKRALGKGNIFFEIEDLCYRAVAARFGLPPVLPEAVNYADNHILVLEKEVLHPRSEPWDLPYPRPVGLRIYGLMPRAARLRFLWRFAQLTGANLKKLLAASEALQ